MMITSIHSSAGAGEQAESLATDYLTKQGYHILERNFRTKLGEIDIIAKDDEAICFVEVRMRKSREHGHPSETITLFKRQRLIRTAQIYLSQKNLEDIEARFDIVAVIPQRSGNYKIEVTKNAFELDE